MKRALLMVALALALSGCHRITIQSGRPAAPTPVVKDKLYSAVVGDVVEIDAPVRLDKLCPEGWAEIHQERSAYAVILELAGGSFYNARTTTVHCGAASDAPVPAPVDQEP